MLLNRKKQTINYSLLFIISLIMILYLFHLKNSCLIKNYSFFNSSAICINLSNLCFSPDLDILSFPSVLDAISSNVAVGYSSLNAAVYFNFSDNLANLFSYCLYCIKLY